MATFLYRLGRFAARRAWLTLGAWVAVLAVLGGLMAAFATPPTAQISIPGAGFQTVLAKLGREIPAAAGGIGTITIETRDGKAFTADQRAAVARTIAAWEKAPHVQSVTDPFANQKRLDDTTVKLRVADRQLTSEEAGLQRGHDVVRMNAAAIDKAKAELGRLERAGQGDGARAQQLRAEISQQSKDNAALADRLRTGDQKIAAARAKVDQGRHMLALGDGLRFVSVDGSATMLQIQFDQAIPQLDPDVRAEVPRIGDQLASAGLRVDYNSDILQTRSVVGKGEVIGLAMAGLVLIVMLGTLVAAGLPLLVGLVGVGAGLLAAMVATAFFQMNSMTPALALMLGLAVGIDYALFIVNRHRQQLLHGMELRHSIGMATGTAGNAVVVAGVTVVISLAALTVTGLPILAQMGLVAAGTVLMTVLVALTVTPAVLSLMGQRVLPRRARRAHERPQRHFGRGQGRWAVHVTNHPLAAIALTVIAIALMAVPAASLRLGLPDGSSEPRDSSAFHSYVTIEKNFGAGANGPIVAMVTLDQPVAAADVTGRQLEIGQRIKDLEGVRQVVPFGVSPDRDTLAFQVVPDEGPTTEATVGLVHDLRELGTELPAGTHLGITGQTVANIEIAERLAAALPLYVVIVVGLSLVLLMAVFRSVVVPLVATAGFLLSVAASFGAVVAVYQWGWLSDLLDVNRPGPILPFMPTLLIGVLFGLAMDYQMFLVSGMHEARAHGEDARAAVRTGFRQGYRVVTAAAIIMVSVFSGFIFAHLTMIRPIGLGLAVGVAVDAFLVRMTLTPAVMHLLGDRAWWIPRWLDRVLPNLDVEGAGLRRNLAQREEITSGYAAGPGNDDTAPAAVGRDSEREPQTAGSPPGRQ